MSSEKIGAVMVVGGGVAGIQASLDLAESGYFVYLVERSPAIGGAMAQLDKTFPTNDCSMCILSPKLVQCGRHNNIRLVTGAHVEGVQGEAGNFLVTLKQEPRYVDLDKCVSCGVCAEKCPVKVPDSFNEGLNQRKAIYSKYAQAVPSAYAIDREHCTFLVKGKTKDGKDRCKLCERFCQSRAVDFGQQEKTQEIKVGSIILAPGFERFDPTAVTAYGYGVYPNVVTSLEFERVLSASGPFRGHLQRPSDGELPRRIAWIQCVGSRDLLRGNGYCSSVCCTYAIKEAIVAKEHAAEELAATIFYIDIRTFGKDFEKYLERAKSEYGVRLVRSRIYALEETDNHNLTIRYAAEDGLIHNEEFDLAVLSVGLRPGRETGELARSLGIELNQYGFCRTLDFAPVSTSRQGIYVCGAFQGPQDIPQTVMQASAAAGSSAVLLSGSRNSLVVEKALPPERDVAGIQPRVGVFVCRCGINIGSVVDVPAVAEFASSLPGVVYSDQCLFACSQDNQQKIKDVIAEHGLNRIVVASCTPRTHEVLFQQTLREAGLNPYLFEMANIREHCSWVHARDKGQATVKAKELVRRAVVKARLLEPLSEVTLGLNRAALVVGGGVAGLNSALDLARQGFKVYLLEKEEQLGGQARRIHYTLEGLDVREYLRELLREVNAHPQIEIHTGAKISEVAGYVGNFTTRFLFADGESRTINHGVAVIAIGGREYRPAEYLYGQNPRVMTGLELDEAIDAGSGLVAGAKNVVMIQCVGSREGARPYCSRVCCSESVKNALRLKSLYPDLNVFILYRDMRTYGFREDYYQEARSKGIIFIRYVTEDKPTVEIAREGGAEKLRVTVFDPILQERFFINADILALAAAIEPPEDSGRLARRFKISRNEEGFFLEAHMKLRPVDFSNDGIFLCGLAHAPKFIEESIAQGKAAAARAMTILARDSMVAGGIVSAVNKERCAGCKVCVDLCSFAAISFNEQERRAEINQLLCKGCGVCAAACPSGACTTRNFGDEIILAEIEALAGSGS